MPDPNLEVTQLLASFRDGDGGALQRLLPLVYEELRSLAGRVFRGQDPQHTLQPTALVHEAWIKLSDGLVSIDNRQHFFIVAGLAMRQVIADHGRGKLAQKRGGMNRRVELSDSLADSSKSSSIDLVDLDDALNRLAENNARHARIVELRLFSGLTIAETAEVLQVSPRVVDSDWAMAKAWLRRCLQSEE